MLKYRSVIAVATIAALVLVAGCGSTARNTVATGGAHGATKTAAASETTTPPQGDAAAIALCQTKMAETKSRASMTVVAGFTSTVGVVDQWKVERTANSPMHPTFSDAELASTEPLTVCFVDGDIQAPMGPSPTAVPYTRATMTIAENGDVQPDVAGTVESLPIVRPSATAGL